MGAKLLPPAASPLMAIIQVWAPPALLTYWRSMLVMGLVVLDTVTSFAYRRGLPPFRL